MNDVATNSVVRSLLPATRFSVVGPDSAPVACAVSGGADSLSLLVLARAAGLSVTAYHVDHGLRPGSDREGDVVARLAASLGAHFVSLRADLADGPNLEARARDARRALMPPGVLTGHTADDQAETILMNLMRGSSTEGLSGMRFDHTKPLLNLRRRDTEALCESLGLTVVHDPSNADPRFQRNRVRHELLPLMADIARRDVAAIVSREARYLGEDDDFLHDLAHTIDVHDAQQLAAAPLPLARRAIRRWLAQPYPPDAATVERVLDVARGLTPGCDVGAGRQVRRSQQRLRLQ